MQNSGRTDTESDTKTNSANIEMHNFCSNRIMTVNNNAWIARTAYYNNLFK